MKRHERAKCLADLKAMKEEEMKTYSFAKASKIRHIENKFLPKKQAYSNHTHFRENKGLSGYL